MTGFSRDSKQVLVMEWSGGIGDVFYWTWVSGHYTELDTLKDGEYATVINRCRTPGLEELLKWHPKKDQIELIDLSWHPREVTSPEDRKVLGLPDTTPHIPLTREPIFYPPPEDLKILGELASSPTVVFALSGSFVEKNVPPDIAEKISSLLLERGYKVVQVGKTYRRRVCRNDAIGFNERVEERISPRKGVIDMIDKLTLPGTCELVRASAAVVCCDSSIMHLSLRMGKPTYMVIPDKWFEYWITIDAASWGKSVPHGRYTKVSDYKDESMVQWLDQSKLLGDRK